MTQRKHDNLSWQWRTPAILAAVALFTLPILCRSSIWAEICCATTSQTSHHDHHHAGHHDHGHHHDHGDHHHPEPIGETDIPQPDPVPECCDTLLASAKPVSGFTKLQELNDNFAACVLAFTDFSVEENPESSAQPRGRPVVFRLQEYCALTSLPHGPPSLG